MTNNLIAGTMAVILSLPAFGQESKAPARPPVEYMLTCPDFLTAENVEVALLAQVKEPGQLAQLLYDYGILFSTSYKAALVAALDTKGIKVPKISSMTNDKQARIEFKDFILNLKSLALGNDSALHDLLWKMVDHIAALNAEHGPGNLTARVRHLQISRLAEALRQSDKRKMFEDLMIPVIRESLVLTAKEGVAEFMRIWGDQLARNISESYALGVFASAIVATNLFSAHWDYQNLENHASAVTGYISEYWPDHFISTVVGYWFGRLGAVVTVNGGFGRRHLRARERKMLEGLTPRMITFPITPDSERTIELRVQSLWQALEQQVTSGALSVEQACNRDTCKLNPLEIAYIGHIDFLELERMRDTLRESLKESAIDARVKALRAAAERLANSDSSVRAQMEFKREIEIFVDELKTLADTRETAKDALIAKIDGVSRAIGELAKKPYSSQLLRARDGDIAKIELLAAKINSDLKGLQQLKVNVEALNEKVQSVREIHARMESTLNDLPNSAQGWRPVAERILLDLDRIPGVNR